MEAPRIWVPKLKIVEAELVAPVGGVAGYFMLETVNRYGRVTNKLGPWKQLITNQGMDKLFYFGNGVSSTHATFRVGTGAPTFTNSSTGLASPVGVASTDFISSSDVTDTVNADAYRVRHTITVGWALGAIIGNLTEIGVFFDGTLTGGYFLDLIRDSGGTPTTFPVTVNDQLRATHILDRYPFLGTTSGSFTIGGSAGSGSHDYDSSMGNLTDVGSGGSGGGSVFGTNNNGVQSRSMRAYKDVSALGANTAGLTGAVDIGAETSVSSDTASNDGTNWFRDATFTYGLTTANDLAGISGFRFSTNNTGRSLKFLIDPPIPKFASSIQRILTIQTRYGLTRV